MKIKNLKYWMLYNLKMGRIGQIIFKLFKYEFSLSREEFLWKYPDLESRYVESLKKEFGDDVQVLFFYKEKNFIDIYYSIGINSEKILYATFFEIPIRKTPSKRKRKEMGLYMDEQIKKRKLLEKQNI